MQGSRWFREGERLQIVININVFASNAIDAFITIAIIWFCFLACLFCCNPILVRNRLNARERIQLTCLSKRNSFIMHMEDRLSSKAVGRTRMQVLASTVRNRNPKVIRLCLRFYIFHRLWPPHFPWQSYFLHVVEYPCRYFLKCVCSSSSHCMEILKLFPC